MLAGRWGAETPYSSGSSYVFVRSLPIVGCFTRGGIFSKNVSLPLLPVLMWSFYPFSWRCSVSFQVCFRGNFSVCSCRFGVSVERDEFRIFFCCHLEQSLNQFLKSRLLKPILVLFVSFLHNFFSWLLVIFVLFPEVNYNFW